MAICTLATERPVANERAAVGQRSGHVAGRAVQLAMGRIERETAVLAVVEGDRLPTNGFVAATTVRAARRPIADVELAAVRVDMTVRAARARRRAERMIRLRLVARGTCEFPVGPFEAVAGPQRMLERGMEQTEAPGLVAARATPTAIDDRGLGRPVESARVHVVVTRRAIARRAGELPHAVDRLIVAEHTGDRVVRTGQRPGPGVQRTPEAMRLPGFPIVTVRTLARPVRRRELPAMWILVARPAIGCDATRITLLPLRAAVACIAGNFFVWICQREAGRGMQRRRHPALGKRRIRREMARDTPASLRLRQRLDREALRRAQQRRLVRRRVAARAVRRRRRLATPPDRRLRGFAVARTTRSLCVTPEQREAQRRVLLGRRARVRERLRQMAACAVSRRRDSELRPAVRVVVAIRAGAHRKRPPQLVRHRAVASRLMACVTRETRVAALEHEALVAQSRSRLPTVVLFVAGSAARPERSTVRIVVAARAVLGPAEETCTLRRRFGARRGVARVARELFVHANQTEGNVLMTVGIDIRDAGAGKGDRRQQRTLVAVVLGMARATGGSRLGRERTVHAATGA